MRVEQIFFVNQMNVKPTKAHIPAHNVPIGLRDIHILLLRHLTKAHVKKLTLNKRAQLLAG